MDARETMRRDLVAHTGLSERRVRQGDRRAARPVPASLNGARGVCVSAAHFAMWELERFLHEYENRYAAECQRREAMMRYAQSTLRRMRYFRNYLDDATDEDCGRCCNCRLALRARRPPRTRMPTAHAREAMKFVKGQRVQHTRFGKGEVLEGGVNALPSIFRGSALHGSSLLI